MPACSGKKFVGKDLPMDIRWSTCGCENIWESQDGTLQNRRKPNAKLF